MKLLLDTHAFLWWLQDSPRLSTAARQSVADPRSAVHVSAASLWEASIKVALGKLHLTRADLPAEVEANGFLELPVRARHAWRAGQLPRHHEDPFDRMLVAQAQIEQLTLVTHDPAFTAYRIPLLLT
jgi:PIN domain nuclease of toxin-antitoxin system